MYGGHVRDSSPLPVSSTLMTSAPRSASRAPHQGPAMTRERSMTRMPSSARGKAVMASLYLSSQALGHQQAALRSHGRSTVLAQHAAPEVHDVSAEARAGRDLDHEPLQPDRLVGKDRTAEPHPVLEADHGGAPGKMGRGQSEEQRGRLGAAGDGTLKTRGRREGGVVMDRVVVAGEAGELGHHRTREPDLGREAIVRANEHPSRSPWPGRQHYSAAAAGRRAASGGGRGSVP